MTKYEYLWIEIDGIIFLTLENLLFWEYYKPEYFNTKWKCCLDNAVEGYSTMDFCGLMNTWKILLCIDLCSLMT